MNFSHDDFIRTTEPRHKAGVAALWQRLIDSGDIYLGNYAGWYSVRDEAFYTESELVDGKAPTGAPVEWVEEPSYFFRLSAWQDRLLAFYEANPSFVLPATRMNEVRSFVKGGLQDLSVSRTTFAWGIPVPNDPDARHLCLARRADQLHLGAGLPRTLTASLYRTFWPADFHVVGKDILRFHAVYWPAFLMSAGLEPPRQVFAHGWWTVEGQKMSKSLGNVVEPVRADREIRPRPDPLLPAARDHLRQRRRLQPRRHGPPDQQRPRQRLRQPGAARAVDDRQELRRHGARARRR